MTSSRSSRIMIAFMMIVVVVLFMLLTLTVVDGQNTTSTPVPSNATTTNTSSTNMSKTAAAQEAEKAATAAIASITELDRKIFLLIYNNVSNMKKSLWETVLAPPPTSTTTTTVSPAPASSSSTSAELHHVLYPTFNTSGYVFQWSVDCSVCRVLRHTTYVRAYLKVRSKTAAEIQMNTRDSSDDSGGSTGSVDPISSSSSSSTSADLAEDGISTGAGNIQSTSEIKSKGSSVVLEVHGVSVAGWKAVRLEEVLVVQGGMSSSSSSSSSTNTTATYVVFDVTNAKISWKIVAAHGFPVAPRIIDNFNLHLRQWTEFFAQHSIESAFATTSGEQQYPRGFFELRDKTPLFDESNETSSSGSSSSGGGGVSTASSRSRSRFVRLPLSLLATKAAVELAGLGGGFGGGGGTTKSDITSTTTGGGGGGGVYSSRGVNSESSPPSDVDSSSRGREEGAAPSHHYTSPDDL